MREWLDDVEVLRIWSVPSPNRGIIRRLISFASYAMGATGTGLLGERYDLIIASMPNPITDMAGIIIGKLRGIPVLLELRDLYPDGLEVLGIRPGTMPWLMIDIYFQKVFQRVDLIAVTSRGMSEALQARGVKADRILLLPHAADPDCVDAGDGELVRERFGLKSAFVGLYAGSFRSHYNVLDFVAAAALLQTRVPRFRLLLLGGGQESAVLEQAVHDKGIRNVIVAGPVSPGEACHYLQAADLFLASSAHIAPSYGEYLSTKVCEYLMVGRPVVAVESSPVLEPMLRRIDAGCSVPVQQPLQLANVICAFAENPERCLQCGSNARSYARSNLTRQTVVAAFEADLRSRLAVLNSRRRLTLVQT